MVRLIPKVIDGKRVWAEDAPEVCGRGHDQLVPTWDQCPACGEMVRLWNCRATEQGERCAEVLVDPEHVHREPYTGPS
jgi:predicted RNA-binding Zn-ribbon protein involved in translation (DUF1610 family)